MMSVMRGLLFRALGLRPSRVMMHAILPTAAIRTR